MIGWGARYLVRQLSLQLAPLLGAALLLLAQCCLLLLHEALGGQQVRLPLLQGSAQHDLLLTQCIQPRAQLQTILRTPGE